MRKCKAVQTRLGFVNKGLQGNREVVNKAIQEAFLEASLHLANREKPFLHGCPLAGKQRFRSAEGTDLKGSFSSRCGELYRSAKFIASISPSWAIREGLVLDSPKCRRLPRGLRQSSQL